MLLRFMTRAQQVIRWDEDKENPTSDFLFCLLFSFFFYNLQLSVVFSAPVSCSATSGLVLSNSRKTSPKKMGAINKQTVSKIRFRVDEATFNIDQIQLVFWTQRNGGNWKCTSVLSQHFQIKNAMLNKCENRLIFFKIKLHLFSVKVANIKRAKLI